MTLFDSGAHTFPTLYKRNSNGSTQQWTIAVDGATITSTYGQVGGKLQTASEVIREGKNAGRANATTPEEQAMLEARSSWEKKQKKGYHTDIDKAKAGTVDEEFVAGGVNPMLAQSFAKHGHKITFPASCQAKLDGHRCIAVVGPTGWVTLWSRTRKPITGVPHIARAIGRMQLPPGTVLDGELYHHDYRDRFEELTSFIRQQTPKPGHEVVQYHVYDLPSSDAPFGERMRWLWENAYRRGSSVRIVRTITVDTADDLGDAFQSFLAEGYEGAMVRNTDSPYVGKRSYDLQKVKEFDDAEFTITGVVEGRGRLAGRGIFVCDAGNGSTFQVKMAGPLEALNEFLEHPERFVGRALTVQFQGKTADGFPRFPVGLRFREDV